MVDVNLFLGSPLVSGGGTVDFQEFVGGLSAFSSRGGREEKLRCVCRMVGCTLMLISLLTCAVLLQLHSRCMTWTGMSTFPMESFSWS